MPLAKLSPKMEIPISNLFLLTDFLIVRSAKLKFIKTRNWYTIDKPFTTYRSRNYVGLSNDAQYIIYIIAREISFVQENIENVTIYKNEKLIKSYTTEEFSGCNTSVEKCTLVCDNGLDIVDEEKSGKDWIYYDGVAPEQIMLFKHPVFMKNDTIYCTNSKKITTVFDLKNQKFIERVRFEKIYSQYSLEDFTILTEHKKRWQHQQMRILIFPN